MISMVMVAVGVYARLLKHAEAAMACLAVDPAILLIVVGVLMFLITFCGCIGSLRENICLLQTFSVCLTVVFLLQLAAGVLGFVFSDKARGKVSEIINGAIVHYRDDLDLQNLIDFGQKEVRVGTWWARVPGSPPTDRDVSPVMGWTWESHTAQLFGVSALAPCFERITPWVKRCPSALGRSQHSAPSPLLQLVGILLSQILVNQIKDQIKLQLYNQQHRADPWY
nr:PREDICTED: tetraspanin-33 [Struthio camelus australis]